MMRQAQAPAALDFWPSCGMRDLVRGADGWLQPTDDWLRRFLARPELALAPESCPAEVAIHEGLMLTPRRSVSSADLAAVQDPDARSNYQFFVAFRDAVLNAGSLEAYYLGLFRQATIEVPPQIVDMLAQVILRNALDGCTDALQARAAELLFRTQRLNLGDGQVLAGDLEALDHLVETSGFGELGRLLVEAQAPVRPVKLPVLDDANAASYWRSDTRFNYLLDLRHELTQNIGQGIAFRLAHARSGLKALAWVLERWVAHLLHVQVSITPLARVEDDQWRWHLGLDTESTAMLNDLYEGQVLSAERMGRLISLFRLDFANPADVLPEVAGYPVYLGLAMTEDLRVRIKPQNLLLNLPLAQAAAAA